MYLHFIHVHIIIYMYIYMYIFIFIFFYMCLCIIMHCSSPCIVPPHDISGSDVTVVGYIWSSVADLASVNVSTCEYHT